MACGEPNRLAQGLVRSELRGLATNGEQILYGLTQDLKRTAGKYFSRNKKLPESEVRRLNNAAKNTLLQQFKAFRYGEAPDIGDLMQGFFWDISKDVLTTNREDVGDFFTEDHIELHLMRHYADRRRAMIDYFHCNLSITFHALQRMIEREEVTERPIAHLSEMSDEILAFTFLHLMTSGQRPPEVAIPLKHGYLVGVDMAFTDETKPNPKYPPYNPLRMRVHADLVGFHVSTATRVRDFRSYDDKPLGLRISTYLSDQMLYEQQTRMFDKLKEFKQTYYQELMLLPRMAFLTGMTNEQLGRSAEDADRFTEMLRSYIQIINHDDWVHSLSR